MHISIILILIFRITSYNVCYTKLLRGQLVVEGKIQSVDYADHEEQP